MIKKGEYAAVGVPEYYILHHDSDRLAFYTRAASGLYAPMLPQDGVIHSRVLPGFRFRLADLLCRPSTTTLRDDPVYRDFVHPEWQAAETVAEQATHARQIADAQVAEEHRARITAEAQAAEEHRARTAAEAEVARLKALLQQRGPDRDEG